MAGASRHGRAPLGTARVRILDAGGNQVPTGVDSEAYTYSGKGWPDFAHVGNDATCKAMERDGYLTVGDCGRVDDEGYIYPSDRIVDMVASGG